MYRPAIISGAILGLFSVILGAFGAHAVKNIISPERMQLYTKATEYQFYHVFAILACGILYSSFPNKAIITAFIFFVLGIIFFSGSLYSLSFVKGDLKALGLINLVTPLGGLMFIAGWCSLIFGLIKK